MKWLAVLGAGLIVVLLVLWKQLDSTSATAAPQPTTKVAAPAAPIAPTPAAVAVAPPVEAPPEAPAPAEGKMDPASDEFFYKHDEMVVPRLSREAVKCYEGYKGELHRNQNMVVKFKQRIRNGQVTIHDITVDKTTLNDPALEACFIQQIRNATWHDARLPEWDQEDEIVLGPRTMKKYTRENIEYVGPEGPKWN